MDYINILVIFLKPMCLHISFDNKGKGESHTIVNEPLFHFYSL